MEKEYMNESVVPNLLNFFNESKHVDVKFQVKCGRCWKSFSAHKLVLFLWSSVWAKELENVATDLDEDGIVTVEITDVTLTAFDALIKFLYGSSAEIEKNKSNVNFVLNVYKAAKKYKIKQLENYCSQLLTKPDKVSLNKDNVFELLNAATYVKDESLKLRCHKFIQTYTEEVLKSRNLETVTPDMILTVLKLPCLSLSSEYEVVSWVYDWASFMYKKNDSAETYKSIIQPFLPYINFTALKPQDFAALVSENKAFFDDAECLQIFMNISLPGSSPMPIWHLEPENKRKFKEAISFEPRNEDPSIDIPLKAENQSFYDVANCNNSVSDENGEANLKCGNGFNASLIENEIIASAEKSAVNGHEPDIFNTAKSEDKTICSSACLEKPLCLETESNNLSSEVIIGHARSISNIDQIKDNSIIETATSTREDESLKLQKKLSNTVHKKFQSRKEGKKYAFDLPKESLVERKKIRKTQIKKFQLNQGFASLPCTIVQERIQDSKFSYSDEWCINVSNRLGLSQVVNIK